LLLDEMFSPRICEALRARGHNVVGVSERPDLRSLPDDDVYAWATNAGCWVLTENVKDFRPLVARALQSRTAAVGVLYSSSRTFPRSRMNVEPLVDAIDKWLSAGLPSPPTLEAWLSR
jgi:hypothetical protein